MAAMWRAVLFGLLSAGCLFALVGCRQIYGLSDPQLIDDAAHARDGAMGADAAQIHDGNSDIALAAYFTMDTLSLGMTPDITGKGHNATCTTNMCATLVEGMFGNALAFDDTPMTIADSSMMLGTGPFSITAWVFLDAAPNSDGCLLSQTNGIGLCLRTDGSVELGMRLPQTSFRTETKIELNVWAFVAVTYAANATTAIVYIGNTGNVGAVQLPVVSNNALVLGGAATGDPIDDFESTLDNLRIYTRVLDVDEIATLAGGGSP
jgi:hypothetical protein